MRVAVTVPYKDNDIQVSIENDIEFGKITDLVSMMTEGMFKKDEQGKMISTMITVSLKLMERVVIEAPWELTDGWSDRIGIRTVKGLLQEVSKLYPLEDLFTGITDALSDTYPVNDVQIPNVTSEDLQSQS